MNRAADQYKLRVKRFLFCGRADKNHLLNQLTDMLDDFQQAKPEADYTEYVATFGEPATCATELLSSLGESKFKAIRKKRLLARRSIYVAILVVFVLISSLLYYKYYQSLYFNEDTVVVIGPATRITEEEAEAAFERTPVDSHSDGGTEK